MPLRIGDVVKLSPDSKWANDGFNNPLNVNGVVQSKGAGRGLNVFVIWENECLNSYREEDLILQEEGVEEPEPFVAYNGAVWRRAAAEFKNPDMVFWDDNAKPAPKAKKPAPVKKNQIMTSMVIQGKEFAFNQDELRELEEQLASHII